MKTVVVLIAVATLWNVQYGCFNERTKRREGGRASIDVARSYLASCARDDTECVRRKLQQETTTSQAPNNDPPIDGFFGDDRFICRLALAVPSPITWVLASAGVIEVDDSGYGEEFDDMSLQQQQQQSSTPVSLQSAVPMALETVNGERVEWFKAQCECRALPFLPAWAQPGMVTPAGYGLRKRIGERVSNVTAEYLLQSVRTSPLFYGSRAAEFETWVHSSSGGESSFYNEAFTTFSDERSVAVIARNVHAQRRTTGIMFLSVSTYDLVLNEFEVVTWSLGSCACSPDTERAQWATRAVSVYLRELSLV